MSNPVLVKDDGVTLTRLGVEKGLRHRMSNSVLDIEGAEKLTWLARLCRIHCVQPSLVPSRLLL